MKNSFMLLFQFLIVFSIPQLLENKNQKLTLIMRYGFWWHSYFVSVTFVVLTMHNYRINPNSQEIRRFF